MGNKHCQLEYSFEDKFDILPGGALSSGLYKLRNRRLLTSNDEHETYELECIIDQKLKNPSPFLTRLLEAQSHGQDSYCSTTNKFYLLFKDTPWLLFDEISRRSAQGRSFSLQQIDNVIARVSKAIKYLYDVYHHHGLVSSRSISWPLHSPHSVQLLDEWALISAPTEGKHRIFRPKDQEDVSEKQLQKSNDLYNLGMVAKQMLNVGAGIHQQTNQLALGTLNQKIQVLLAKTPHERLQIYNMVSIGRDYVQADNLPIETKVQTAQKSKSYSGHPDRLATFTSPTISTQYSSTNYQPHKGNPINYPILGRSSDQSPLKVQQIQNFQSVNYPLLYNPQSNQQFNQQLNAPLYARNANLSASKATFVVPHTHLKDSTLRNSSMGRVPSSNPQLVPTHHNLPLSQPPGLSASTEEGVANKIRKPGINFSISGNLSQPRSDQSKLNRSISFNHLLNQGSSAISIGNREFWKRPSMNSEAVPDFHSNRGNSGGSSNVVNLSFRKSLDQGHSLKLNTINVADGNLFTPSDFFAKIQSHSFPREESLDENISLKYSAGDREKGQNLNQFVSSAQIEQKLVPIPGIGTGPTEVTKSFDTSLSKWPTIQGPSSVVADSLNPGTHETKQIEIQVFQNIANTLGPKMIDIQKGAEEVFQKVATNHPAYQIGNIVLHVPNKQSESSEKDYDFVKTTPGKNSRSNQPFSTIPEVSQRSASARSDEEKEYVIEQYENGSRYEGYKSNGMRNGKGKFYYQEGSFYDGEWKNNNMHGYGKLYYSNNKLAYEGDWFIDQFHGRGKVYNDDPSSIFGYFDYTNFDNLDEKWKYYEGDLVCDSKEGEGKLVLSNDEYYEGQFRNDKVDGRGKFVTKAGQVIKGVWEQSKLVLKL